MVVLAKRDEVAWVCRPLATGTRPLSISGRDAAPVGLGGELLELGLLLDDDDIGWHPGH